MLITHRKIRLIWRFLYSARSQTPLLKYSLTRTTISKWSKLYVFFNQQKTGKSKRQMQRLFSRWTNEGESMIEEKWERVEEKVRDVRCGMAPKLQKNEGIIQNCMNLRVIKACCHIFKYSVSSLAVSISLRQAVLFLNIFSRCQLFSFESQNLEETFWRSFILIV